MKELTETGEDGPSRMLRELRGSIAMIGILASVCQMKHQLLRIGHTAKPRAIPRAIQFTVAQSPRAITKDNS